LTFLLDTNVVSELRKANRDARVVAWAEGADPLDLHVSVLAIGEIRQGIERLRNRRDDRQADILEAWLTRLKRDFSARLLPVSTAIAERWGRLNAARQLPEIDGLMTATAVEHGLTLVTRDTGMLREAGVRLLDPWQA
jgi:predicted nucleic acid-binding protein